MQRLCSGTPTLTFFLSLPACPFGLLCIVTVGVQELPKVPFMPNQCPINACSSNAEHHCPPADAAAVDIMTSAKDDKQRQQHEDSESQCLRVCMFDA
jgi:hypothetical protein